MTTIARRRTRSRRRRDAHPGRAPLPTIRPSAALAPAVNPHHRGGTVLFEVPFASPMTDADLDLLRHHLDMTILTTHKLPVDPNSPGVVRLDHFSGLFLEHGEREDRWTLQARTWGAPSAQTVHDWHVCAAQAARRLDGQVPPLERLAQGRDAGCGRQLD